MHNLSDHIPVMKIASPEDLSKGTILTAESHKVSVSNAHHAGEYLSTITYLLPFNLSGINVCDHATASCKAICLGYKSGHADMLKEGHTANATRVARMRRVYLMERYPRIFKEKLVKELHAFCKKALKKGVRPAYRFNGSSDLDIETWTMPGDSLTLILEYFGEKYGMVAYDYTKDLSRALAYVQGRLPDNYHLTFSYTPETEQQARIALDAGINVAVAFNTKDKSTFVGKRFLGSEIIDGDQHDLRFTDPQGGYIVGLTKKGRHKGPFFVDPDRTEPLLRTVA